MCAVHANPPVTGFPGSAPSMGLPVFLSTLAAIAFHIGLRCCHACFVPPGMSDGPKRAPSSPPDTPDPTKCIFLVASWFSRRMVSSQRLFPPSMTMSSLSSRGRSCAMTASTGPPAFTRMIILRGLLIDLTKAFSCLNPMSPPGVSGFSFTNFSVVAVVLLKTATLKPWSAMLSTRFCPMTARPMSPMSAVGVAFLAILLLTPRLVFVFHHFLLMKLKKLILAGAKFYNFEFCVCIL